MKNKFYRFLITVVGAIIGYCFGTVAYMLAASTYENGVDSQASAFEIAVPVCSAVFVAIVAYLYAPRIRRSWSNVGTRLEKDMERISVVELAGGILGLLIGLLAAFLLSALFKEITYLYMGLALTILAYIAFCTLGVYIGTKLARVRIEPKLNSEDRKSIFHANAKTGKGKGKGSSEAKAKILDTSVLIDGRIVDILKTGFIEGKIIVPEFVLTELRHLSDSADHMKKIRGRRGLEILKDIQAYYGIEIYNTYSDKDWNGVEEVDLKLLRLAQKMNGKVVTNDFNLIQVAEIQDIPVLNINDVVKALRPVIFPGESMKLQIVREGRENNQGVGYLDDGTMIVVEGGRYLIGQEVSVEVTSVLQTASGRMIFAKPKR